MMLQLVLYLYVFIYCICCFSYLVFSSNTQFVFVFTDFIGIGFGRRWLMVQSFLYLCSQILQLLLFISCICFKTYFVFVFTEFIGQVRKVQDDAAASLCHRWAPHPPRWALILKTLPALLCICICISAIRICLFVYFDIFSTHSS